MFLVGLLGGVDIDPNASSDRLSEDLSTVEGRVGFLGLPLEGMLATPRFLDGFSSMGDISDVGPLGFRKLSKVELLFRFSNVAGLDKSSPCRKAYRATIP